MAFPTFQSVTRKTFVAGTSHLVTMPATVNPGDLLIIVFAGASQTDNPTDPSGWDVLAAVTNECLWAWKKSAVGDEDGTDVNIVTADSSRGCSHVYRYTDWADIVIGANTTGTDATAEVANLTTGWGAVDVGWLVCMGIGGTLAPPTISSYPTNYSNGVTDNITGTGADAMIATARRDANAASEDPDQFTMNANDDTWDTRLIAIRGSAAATNITPSAVAITIVTAAPTVSLSLTIAPSPVVIPIITAAPSLSFIQTISPSPVTIPLVVTTPSITTVVVTPNAVAIPIVTASPTLTLTLTISPSSRTITIVVAAPTLIFGQTISPSAVAIPIAVPAPIITIEEVVSIRTWKSAWEEAWV